MPWNMTTAISEVRCDFRCSSCGHTARCYVVGRGSVFRLNRTFFDESRPIHERAATYLARWNARQLASMLSCPACGARDRRAWNRARIVACLGAALPTFAFFVAGAITTPPRNAPPEAADLPGFLYLFGVFSFALGTYVLVRRLHDWRTVDGRVTFEPASSIGSA